jgi:hypothetical protein
MLTVRFVRLRFLTSACAARYAYSALLILNYGAIKKGRDILPFSFGHV